MLKVFRPDLGHVWDLVCAGRLDALTPQQAVHWLVGQSGLHERQGAFAQGLRCALQAQALAEAGHWDELKADSLMAQSSLHYSLGQFAQARAAALASLALAGSAISAVGSLNVLGLCATESADMDIETAAGYFHRAADLSRLLDYPLGHAMALNWLGQGVYRVRGELDLMRAACDEANQILTRFHFPYNGHYYVHAYYHWLTCDRAALRRVLAQMRAIEPYSVFAAGARAYYTAMLALDEERAAAAAEAIGELRCAPTSSFSPATSFKRSPHPCAPPSLVGHPQGTAPATGRTLHPRMSGMPASVVLPKCVRPARAVSGQSHRVCSQHR